VNRRRDLLVLLGATYIAPRIARAQAKPPAGRLWRIGFFYTGSRQSALDTGRYPAFLQGMRELGYIEGKHFVLEERFVPESEIQRLPALAAEFAQSQVDLIVATGGVARVLVKATTTIPVVVTVTTNPIREGMANSLARPGGNFTGLAAFLDEVFPKHVEMLKLALPKISRIAALSNSRNPAHPHLLKGVEAVAHHHGILIQHVPGDTLEDIERAIGTAARQRAQALIILGDAFFVQHFRQIAGFALRDRLASIYSGHEYPEAGGLMSYGPNFAENYRRAATYVDKILRGAKPGDLPFEQPTKFELVVNRKTANALGIKLSEELLFRADRVIE
jgi:putative tryptophan/tyrosine transport system substrate-binding protein